MEQRWALDWNWAGSDFDEFVEFKLRPECELFHNLRIRTGIGLG